LVANFIPKYIQYPASAGTLAAFGTLFTILQVDQPCSPWKSIICPLHYRYFSDFYKVSGDSCGGLNGKWTDLFIKTVNSRMDLEKRVLLENFLIVK
jgi:hypothetical protein